MTKDVSAVAGAVVLDVGDVEDVETEQLPRFYNNSSSIVNALYSGHGTIEHVRSDDGGEQDDHYDSGHDEFGGNQLVVDDRVLGTWLHMSDGPH